MLSELLEELRLIVSGKWNDYGRYPLAQAIDGNSEHYEREALCYLIEQMGLRTVFEIGTYNGLTAQVMGMMPEIESVWTLDLPAGSDPVLPVSANPDDRRWMGVAVVDMLPDSVTLLHGDSATFDFRPWHGRCDLVYVMGAHSDEYIDNDLAVARQLRTGSGVVVLNCGSFWPMHRAGNRHRIHKINERMGIVEY